MNDTASRNLGRIKEDYKALGMQAKSIGAQVIFSSILPVRGKGLARNRCIMQINFWLRGWCRCEGFGFYDNGTFFDDYSLLGRDGIHLSRRGKGIFGSSLAGLGDCGSPIECLWVKIRGVVSKGDLTVDICYRPPNQDDKANEAIFGSLRWDKASETQRTWDRRTSSRHRDFSGRPLIPVPRAHKPRPLDGYQKQKIIPVEVNNAVIPVIWAGEVPGKSKRAAPVRIDLKPGSSPVRIKQYPLKLESRKGLVPIIQKFLKYKLLIECESKYNTPILPVKKANGKDYRLVQDLRAINQIVQDIHPVVANPNTLLTTLTEKQEWFTVLDLKDAFFCIPLDPNGQELLLLNGKILRLGEKRNIHGQSCLKALRTALPFLEINWHEN
ncbi:uncharacterized protein LOC121232754 [Aquila chrysaetos chrysaetos]|uniref:uncharacterized protein LOC121232754 n=1 Tax=Aquila chrysaetos chrysaetos TaxID=223781 RepID=UPI001B7D33D9|nr:uncharacterized protein LOC121232754 [Aquila chrysaetos chrysaetos]